MKRSFLFPALPVLLFLAVGSVAGSGEEGGAYDLAVVNAVIHIGAKGEPSFRGGVGIRGDRIAAIWQEGAEPPRAKKVIDAAGADLAPGFIDTHSHADLSLNAKGAGRIKADNFVGQGISTIVVGNCGRSQPDIPLFVRNLKKRKSNVNIATLIGLNSVRSQVMGSSSRAANQSEIAAMCRKVQAGMEAGAVGVSTGLAYPTGIFASGAEIVEQLKVAAKYGGVHASHIRDEGQEVAQAVAEVLDYSRSAEIPLLLSHFKITGLTNCGQFEELTKMLAQARAAGLSVYVDYYPYDASSTDLNIFLPKWYLALKRKAKLGILSGAPGRARLKEGVKDLIGREGFSDLQFATVASQASHPDWGGKSVSDIDLLRGTSPSTVETQLDVFLELERRGGAQMIYRELCPEVVERLPKEEENMVGTDSAIRYDSRSARPHPRGWGAFPRFLRLAVREGKILTLDEAVYRITGLPAKLFALEGRGTIREGNYADLVVFDSEKISDGATYSEPFVPPKGIRYVLVNGRVVVDNEDNKSGRKGGLKEEYPGRFLPRGKREEAPTY